MGKLILHTTAAPNVDPRVTARQLYWQGWRISDIAQHINIKPSVVYSWKNRDNWDGGSPMQRVAASAETRLHLLINKPSKSDADYKEIKSLYSLIDGRPRKTAETAAESASTGTALPDISDGLTSSSGAEDARSQNRKQGKARRAKKAEPNFFSDEQITRATQIFHDQLFEYQRFWLSCDVRFRNLLKSRQIGATFFFAREALIKALKTGNNQIFLSASRAQAFQFKQYIIDLAQAVGVELKGDAIRLQNAATLYFLGTNSRTAQGRHGDLYVDEYFWIPDFKELTRLAKPMAAQKQYRITYFSTPSSTSHPAYGFWNGQHFNEGRPKSEHISLDVSPAALSNGRACEDGQFRHIVTLDDAERGGCNLFDRNQLLLENSPAEFRQLFMCEFVESGDTVFKFDDLQRCTVDSWTEWGDFYKPLAARPVGNLPVWIGYDPADSGDAAALIAVLPPRQIGDKFRIVERHMLHGNDFQAQADFIRKMLDRYNVEKIVIDKTGLGAAVFQLVQGFFPAAIGVVYSLTEKYLMINKMHALMRSGRVEWEIDYKDITAAFLSIRTVATSSGKNVTYASSRSAELSHADVAWAALQVFYQEPLDGGTTGRGSVDIY